ncbi:hypothetical protein M406DRAFT_262386, partial [Cryphonectria parasitica EP155]
NRIAAWAEDHQVYAANSEEPTHKAGNTINLVFTSLTDIRTNVLQELYTGSDHYTL